MVANKAQSCKFTKIVDVGQIAQTVIYTVPEGKYYEPTQEEADYLALKDVYTKGQDYANTHDITFVYNPFFDCNPVEPIIIPDPKETKLEKAREIIYGEV